MNTSQSTVSSSSVMDYNQIASSFSLRRLLETPVPNSETNLNESSNLSESQVPLRWTGNHLYQAGLIVAAITEHRRWWTIRSNRSGVPEQRFSKREFPTIKLVQKQYTSNMLVAAYTLKDPAKRGLVVGMFKNLLESI